MNYQVHESAIVDAGVQICEGSRVWHFVHTTSVYGFGHPLYYKNVVDVLRGEAEPETDGCEGLKSLELLIAAYLSVRDGRTITLTLEY